MTQFFKTQLVYEHLLEKRPSWERYICRWTFSAQ